MRYSYHHNADLNFDQYFFKWYGTPLDINLDESFIIDVKIFNCAIIEHTIHFKSIKKGKIVKAPVVLNSYLPDK